MTTDTSELTVRALRRCWKPHKEWLSGGSQQQQQDTAIRFHRILPQYELDNQGPSAKMLAERGVSDHQETSFRQAGQAILTQVTLGVSYVLAWHPWYEKNRAHHPSVGDQSVHRVALRLD